MLGLGSAISSRLGLDRHSVLAIFCLTPAGSTLGAQSGLWLKAGLSLGLASHGTGLGNRNCPDRNSGLGAAWLEA